MQTIQIEIRNVYGNTVAYPVDTQAKVFAAIAGHKTLTRSTLQGVLSLGYSVQVRGIETRTYRPGESTSSGALATL